MNMRLVFSLSSLPYGLDFNFPENELYEFRVRDTFRVRDAGKIFENIKAVPQHSSESQ